MDYEEKIIELESGVKMELQYDAENECYADDIVITDIGGNQCSVYVSEFAELFDELSFLGLV